MVDIGLSLARAKSTITNGIKSKLEGAKNAITKKATEYKKNPFAAVKDVFVDAPIEAVKTPVKLAKGIAREAVEGVVQPAARAIQRGVVENVSKQAVEKQNYVDTGRFTPVSKAEISKEAAKRQEAFNEYLFQKAPRNIAERAFKSVAQATFGRPVNVTEQEQAADVGMTALNYLLAGKGKAVVTAAKSRLKQTAKKTAETTFDKTKKIAIGTAETSGVVAAYSALGAARDGADRQGIADASALGFFAGAALGVGLGGLTGTSLKISPKLKAIYEEKVGSVKYLDPVKLKKYKEAKKKAERYTAEKSKAVEQQKIASKNLDEKTQGYAFKKINKEIKDIEDELTFLKDVADDASIATRKQRQERLTELQSKRKELLPTVMTARFSKKRKTSETQLRKAEESYDSKLKKVMKETNLSERAILNRISKGQIKGVSARSLVAAFNKKEKFSKQFKEVEELAKAEDRTVIKAVNKITEATQKIKSIEKQLTETELPAKKKVLTTELKVLKKQRETDLKSLKETKKLKKADYKVYRKQALLEKYEKVVKEQESSLVEQLGLTPEQWKNGLDTIPGNNDSPYFINTNYGVAIPRALSDAARFAKQVRTTYFLPKNSAANVMDGVDNGIIFKLVYKPLEQAAKREREILQQKIDELANIGPVEVPRNSIFASSFSGLTNMFNGKKTETRRANTGVGSLYSDYVMRRGTGNMTKQQWLAMSPEDRKLVQDGVKGYRKYYDQALKEINEERVYAGLDKIIIPRKNYFRFFNDEETPLALSLVAGQKSTGGNGKMLRDALARSYEIKKRVASDQGISKAKKSDKPQVYDAYKGASQYASIAAKQIAQTRPIQYLRAISDQSGKDGGVFFGNNAVFWSETANRLTGTPTFVRDFIKKAGTIAEGGRAPGKETNFETMLRRYNAYISFKNMGLSTGNAILQTSQLALSWANFGTPNMIQAVMDYTPETMAAMAKSVFVPVRKSKQIEYDLAGSSNLNKAAFFLTAKADDFTLQVMWKQAYRAAKDSDFADDAAIDYADNYTRDIMGNMSKELGSDLVSNPILRALSPHQSFVINQYKNLTVDTRKWLKTKSGARVFQTFLNLVLTTQITNAIFEEADLSQPFQLQVQTFVPFISNPRYGGFADSTPVKLVDTISKILSGDFDGVRDVLEGESPGIVKKIDALIDMFLTGTITPLGSKQEIEADADVTNAYKIIMGGAYATPNGQSYLDDIASDEAEKRITDSISSFFTDNEFEAEAKAKVRNYKKIIENPNSVSALEYERLNEKLATMPEEDPAEYELYLKAYRETLPPLEDITEGYKQALNQELDDDEYDELQNAINTLYEIDPEGYKEFEDSIADYVDQASNI